MDEPLLTTRDVCRLLGIGQSTLYVYRAGGHFPDPVHVGLPDARRRTLRWRMSDLRGYMRGQQ